MAASGYPGGGRMGTYWIWDRSDFVEVGVNGAVIRLAVVGSLLAGVGLALGALLLGSLLIDLFADGVESLLQVVHQQLLVG